MSLCREVLKVTEVVETGIATKIGLAAYELGSALAWIMNTNKTSGGVVQNPYLFEAIKSFEKAAEILSFEPLGSNNALVGESAEKELIRIKAELPAEN